MKILGACNAHDSGAALISDGELMAAANEERFVRKKLVQTFPVESIRYVLDIGGISPAEVDWVACSAWAGIDQSVTLPRLIEDSIFQSAHGEFAQAQALQRINVTARRDADMRREFVDGIRALGINENRIVFCDHHRSNATMAFYPSPFEEAIILCAGGRGDFRSLSLWRADRKSGLDLIDFATELTSPGAFYGMLTELLGFSANRHEGKVTGLAGFGEASELQEVLAESFYFDQEAGRMRAIYGDFYRPFATAQMDKLKKLAVEHRKEDIAYAAQSVLERNIVDFFNYHTKDMANKAINLCLAGGCIGNVKLNFELSKLSQVEKLYVFPCMGDGGNAVGGAIHVAVEKFGQQHYNLPHVYLGSAYSDADIMSELDRHQVVYQKVTRDERIDRVARAIADNKVVGWFQGRMEYGPRALGARSILASATDATINDSLNQRLDRTEFMPFAPVVRDESAPGCFVDWDETHVASRYMTTCYDCTDFLRERCPAVVHVDGTARPQVIFEVDNPDYYSVVARYDALTGNPAIINTSFNHHEEPIVRSPDDAIRCYKRGNIDLLAIGNFIAEVK